MFVDQVRVSVWNYFLGAFTGSFETLRNLSLNPLPELPSLSGDSQLNLDPSIATGVLRGLLL